MIGSPEEGLELLAEIPSDPEGNSTTHRTKLGGRGMLRLWTDDLQGAQTDLQACLPATRLTLAQSMEPYRLVALSYLVETDFRCGDWDQAAQLAEQVVSLVEDTGQVWLRALAHSVAVLTPAGRGQWTVAQHHQAAAQRAAAELGDHASLAYANNAAVHLAHCRGDAEGVVQAAQWLLHNRRDLNDEPGLLDWPVHHVGALIELGHLEEATARITQLDKIAIARARRSRMAALARVRAELTANRRDLSTARTAFEDALKLGDGSVGALEAAATQASFGRFLRRRGERRAAVDRLTTARALFAALGAEPFLERCDDELAACGTKLDASEDPAHLTPQERKVARLVCAGLTNRQVADELVLSIKTVGYHLDHVYTKLGVTSRMELVTRLGAEPRNRHGIGTHP